MLGLGSISDYSVREIEPSSIAGSVPTGDETNSFLIAFKKSTAVNLMLKGILYAKKHT